MRANAVADANVVQTLVSNDQNLIDHLDQANVRVERAARLRLMLERHAQRRCKPSCCKKQNSRNQVLTGFEPPTPGRDPKVTLNESACLTSH